MPESNELLSAGAQLIGMPLAGPESFSQQQLDYLKRALGVDETVLWSGTHTGAYTFQLSETVSNFEKIRIAIGFDQGIIEYKDVAIPSGTLNALGVSVSRADSSAFWSFTYPLTFNADKTNMSIAAGKGFKCNGSSITNYYANNTECVVYGIWGIHRIAGGN